MRRLEGLAALFLVLAASACVSPSKAGVAIDSIEADVVFGGKTDLTPVLPANTDPGQVPDTNLDAGFELPPFRNAAADRLPPLHAIGQSSNPCPSAPLTAGALLPVESRISGPVREGVYLWKRDGTQITPVTGVEPIKKQIKGFERRIVRNVQPYDDPFDADAYTFELVQTLVDAPIVQVRTYLVKPATTLQYEPGGPGVVDEPRLNDPEGGISVIKVEEFDENDQGLGTFEPNTGLLQLGLPVDPSEPFQSVAVDTRSGQAIVQDAAVKGRARIDACGDLIDGWRVESTQTRSDATGQVGYNAIFATQYGGVPILEEIATVGADGSELNITFTLAQIDPDPLP